MGLCKSRRIQRLLITSRSVEPARSRLIACRVEQIVKFFFFRTLCKCLPPDISQPFISRSPQRGTSEQGKGEKKEAAVSILKGQIQITPAYNLSLNNLGGDRTMLRFCREIRIASENIFVRTRVGKFTEANFYLDYYFYTEFIRSCERFLKK